VEQVQERYGLFKLLGQMMPDWEQRKPRLEAALL
jgi:hypothetical protein